MNKYPALIIVSAVYRLSGILAGLGVVVGSVLIADDLLIALIGVFVGVIIGASLFAVGELILLLISMGKYQYTSAEALVKMYKDRTEAKPQRRIRSLKKGA